MEENKIDKEKDEIGEVRVSGIAFSLLFLFFRNKSEIEKGEGYEKGK